MQMDKAFKLVILFDAKHNSYTVADHNLTPEEAAWLVQDLHTRFLPALTVIQEMRHKRQGAEACRACRQEVARTSGLTPRPRFQRRNHK
jgi:hypothetical protein